MGSVVRFLLVAGLAVLSGTAQADPIKVRIGWIAMPGPRAGYLTEKPELLKHYNQSYTIDAIHFSSTPAELTALASGELDIAQFAFSSFATAIENAHMDDVRLIADELEDGANGYGTTNFMVLKDSSFRSIDDLRGKVLATNGIGSGIDMAMRYIFRKHGMEDKRDYTDVEVQFPNMRATLADKKIDMASVVLPFIYDPQIQAVARTLFKQGDQIGPSELLMWASRKPYIDKNHAALVDLMEDVLRAQRWYFDPANHAEAIQIVAKITKQPPEALDWVFTERDFYRNPDGAPDMKAVAANLEMMKNLGYLKTDIDAPKYADLSLVNEAAARLNK